MVDKPIKKGRAKLLTHLENAIHNLEIVSHSTAKDLPTVYEVELKEHHLQNRSKSPFRKFFSWLTSLFPKKHREMGKQRQKVKKELLHSIEVLKKHYRLILKLQEGTHQEQALAERALKSIKDYNTLIKKSQKTPSSLTKRVVKFISEQSGLAIIDDELKNITIDLPTQESILKIDTALDRAVSKLKGGRKIELTKNESDMFYMRGFSLAKNALPPTLTKELISMMRSQPISAHAKHPTDEISQSTIISMMQQLTPFPGETITVEGSFERNAQSKVSSVPLPQSFRVTTIVTQTGFPHPSQYHGWALTNTLIPDHPLRLDLLPIFEKIYQRKQQVARDLLPTGPLYEKAKTLFKYKKEAFTKDLLPKERALALAIINASGREDIDKAQTSTLIQAFFDKLDHHVAPFDYLSQTYSLINSTFIDRLYDTLHSEWLDNHHPGLMEGLPKQKIQVAQGLLDAELIQAEQEINKEIAAHPSENTLPFVRLFGKVLGPAAKSIILHYFSEKIGYPPPLLTSFEHRLQMSAFIQLMAFHHELTFDISDQPKTIKRLHALALEQIQADIHLFTREINEAEKAAKVTNELERYYISRYTAKLKE